VQNGSGDSVRLITSSGRQRAFCNSVESPSQLLSPPDTCANTYPDTAAAEDTRMEAAEAVMVVPPTAATVVTRAAAAVDMVAEAEVIA
jgi:hypothetical protein